MVPRASRKAPRTSFPCPFEPAVFKRQSSASSEGLVEPEPYLKQLLCSERSRLLLIFLLWLHPVPELQPLNSVAGAQGQAARAA